MSVGDVAGLIAAIAFVLLVGALAIPLIKLGGVLAESRNMNKGVPQRLGQEHPPADHGGNPPAGRR
jgi:hypothetical protein